MTTTPYGMFPTNYRHARLGELCVEDGGVKTGPFGSQLHLRDYVPIGTPIITVEHLGENRIIHRELPRVSDEDRKRLSRYSLRPGDIVFSRVGSVDLRALVREEESGWLFSGRLLRIRPKLDLIDPGYLSWFFGLPLFREYVRRIAFGATMPSLNTKLLSDLPVYFPSIDQQRAIAHILGTLDDKIELNRRMNETLEAIARAIFKSWFVDFNPVRAKIEGRQPYGMDAETAALFPDSFEDSPLGKIPKGWPILPAGEAVKAVGGSTPSTKNPEYWEGGTFFWATPKDLSTLTSPVLLETERKITDRGIAQISSGLLPRGTVLMSSRAPVGYLALSTVPVAVNQGFIAMVCDGPVSNYYVLNWCHHNMEEIQQRAIGTTFAEISKSAFRPIPMIVPAGSVMIHFTQLIEPLYKAIEERLKESRALATLRDALLPKLISGQLRVKEAERFLK